MEHYFNLNQIMNAKRFKDHEDLENHFNFVADKILNHIILNVDKDSYRITEIEFYFFNELHHPDPYIHNHPLQKETGHWYFHGSGLDITFGDGINYGGILIRGIKKINSNEPQFISGPLKVVAEIFKSLGNMSDKDHELRIVETDYLPDEEIVKSTRVGLKVKPVGAYHEKYYRYLSFPYSKEHSYSEKTKVANALINTERQIECKRKLTVYDINSLFGWKILNI